MMMTGKLIHNVELGKRGRNNNNDIPIITTNIECYVLGLVVSALHAFFNSHQKLLREISLFVFSSQMKRHQYLNPDLSDNKEHIRFLSSFSLKRYVLDLY